MAFRGLSALNTWGTAEPPDPPIVVPPICVSVGVDIGQRHDPTALCVAEAQERIVAHREPMFGPPEEEREVHFLLRHMERLPLGTPYPAVADRICALVEALYRQDPTYQLHCLLDRTGVGLPVVDLIRDRLASNGMTKRCQVTGVVLTGGEQGDPFTSMRREASLSKTWMVSRLQALLQTRRLHVGNTAAAKDMARELLAFQMKVTDAGRDSYNARTGEHDDYITALALATISEPHRMRVITPGLYF